MQGQVFTLQRAFDQLDDPPVFFEDVFRHGLPGRRAAAGFDMFKRISAGKADSAIDKNGEERLLAHRPTQVLGDGDDTLGGVAGVIVQGKAKAGDIGTDAGEGAVLAVFVEAVLARDDKGAVVAVSQGAQAGPEVDQLPGVGFPAQFEQFFQRIDEQDQRLMFFDTCFNELQQMERDGGSRHRIRCFGVIFQTTQVIVVGVLMSQELDHHRTLLGRGENEDGLIVLLIPIMGEVISEHGGHQRFADAGDAIEQHQFTTGNEVGDKPALDFDRFGGGEGEEFGHEAPRR